MSDRVLRIKSHAGISRYLSKIGDPIGWIVRHLEIPSPYSYGPSHAAYADSRAGKVFIVETAHKQYDVFRVDLAERIYPTDDAAAAANTYRP